jgi:hypothetical protein
VRIHATKKVLYQGQIVSNISSAKRISSSQESLEIKACSVNEETKKPKLDTIRLKVHLNLIQFESHEACEEFLKCFELETKQK